jgi:trehalose 6-phosphate synthase
VPTARRLIVVSNRAPVRYERSAEGRLEAHRSSGGLVTALRALVSRYDVTWIASASTDAERELAKGGPREETGIGGARYRLCLISHDPYAYELYYDVVANPTLWFVQHGLWELKRDAGADVSIPWREGYRAVNAAFAEAVLAELERDQTAAVLFQDYHLYVAPRLVRERAPDALLSHFVHVPWVGPDAWAVLPPELAREIHDGLLANDVIGFHTPRWRDAFCASCDALLGPHAADGKLIAATPISVDPTEFEAMAESEEVLECQRGLVAARPEWLLLRVDRTDPSKNVVRGFEAYGRLLDRRPDLHGRVAMLALLDPSRQEIPEYREYLAAIQRVAAEVNERFRRPGWEPVRLDVRDDFPLSVAAYKEYDVLLVNPVMDGMNLVAKEAPLVNTRDGVLVLSRQAGAFDELERWVVPVDPHDLDSQANALEQALELPAEDRHRRLAGIRSWVREHDLDAWLSAQLDALERASSMRAERRGTDESC